MEEALRTVRVDTHLAPLEIRTPLDSDIRSVGFKASYSVSRFVDIDENAYFLLFIAVTW